MKRPVKHEGDLCRHCDTPVFLKESKFHPSKLDKPYYYNAYLRCPNCLAMYMLERFKVINKKHYVVDNK